MLTSTMPAVVKALQQVLDPTTLKAFTQALGNCNQPVTQRGPVDVQQNNFFLRGGEYPGQGDSFGYSTYDYSQYNPFFQNIYAPNFGDFNPIFPAPNPPISILPPDLGPGDNRIDLGDTINNNINNNLYNSQFFFNNDQTFNSFGGPTNNFFGGDTYIDRSYTNNSTTNVNNTTNLNVTNINGNPVQGPSGPPGRPGADGRDGRDGAPGAPGAIVPFPFPVITPIVVPPPANIGLVPKDYEVLVPGAEPFVEVPKFKLSGQPSFDPDTCTIGLGDLAIEQDGTTIVNLEGGYELGTVTVFGPPDANAGQ